MKRRCPQPIPEAIMQLHRQLEQQFRCSQAGRAKLPEPCSSRSRVGSAVRYLHGHSMLKVRAELGAEVSTSRKIIDLEKN
jgi:hypothetical protein